MARFPPSDRFNLLPHAVARGTVPIDAGRLAESDLGGGDRRCWLKHAAVGLIASGLGGCTGTDRPSTMLRVTGPSMGPTLWGPHFDVLCQRCGLSFPIHRGSPSSSGEAFVCWHCGDPIPAPSGTGRPGDVVTVDPTSTITRARREDPPLRSGVGETLRVGDLIAIDWQDRLRVKRLFALPGETVSARAGRLYRDGRRLELSPDFVAPTLPVDLDAHRADSRWTAGDGGRRWQRTDRCWRATGPGPTPWLIYAHRSVYEGGRPGPVRDDYPGNARLVRRLQPVDALVLEAEVQFETSGELEVVFWAAGKIWRQSQPGSGMTRFRFARHRATVSEQAAEAGLPLGATQPVALRLTRGRGIVTRLAVRRAIEYRQRRRDSGESYPIRLAADECFVVGDNVPVSVDSREFGPVPLDRIVGGVEVARGERREARGERREASG